MSDHSLKGIAKRVPETEIKIQIVFYGSKRDSLIIPYLVLTISTGIENTVVTKPLIMLLTKWSNNPSLITFSKRKKIQDSYIYFQAIQKVVIKWTRISNPIF